MCWDPSLKLLLPLRRRMSGKGALSRLLLRVRFSLIYIVDLFLGQWFLILVFAGDAEFAPRVSGRDDLPTGVDADGQTSGIASCGLQLDVSEVVHSRSRSWELREQAFDDGKNHVRMRNLLVLFLIGSRFHLFFAFKINLSPNPAATVVHATGHQIVCFCRSVSGVEKAQLPNPVMKSGHSRWICICAISSVCVMYFLCWQIWMKYWFSCETFVVRSVEFPEMFRITLCFFLGGSSNVVDVAHTVVIWGCS